MTLTYAIIVACISVIIADCVIAYLIVKASKKKFEGNKIHGKGIVVGYYADRSANDNTFCGYLPMIIIPELKNDKEYCLQHSSKTKEYAIGAELNIVYRIKSNGKIDAFHIVLES